MHVLFDRRHSLCGSIVSSLNCYVSIFQTLTSCCEFSQIQLLIKPMNKREKKKKQQLPITLMTNQFNADFRIKASFISKDEDEVRILSLMLRFVAHS